MAAKEATDSDKAFARVLIARGNDLKTAATVLNVTQASLKDLAAELAQRDKARTMFEAGDEVTEIVSHLGIAGKRADLKVSAWARNSQWQRPKGYVAPVKKATTSTGRPRVANNQTDLEAAAKRANEMAQEDTKLNLKLAIIKAMAEGGVTDINGVIAECQKLNTFWKARPKKA